MLQRNLLRTLFLALCLVACASRIVRADEEPAAVVEAVVPAAEAQPEPAQVEAAPAATQEESKPEVVQQEDPRIAEAASRAAAAVEEASRRAAAAVEEASRRVAAAEAEAAAAVEAANERVNQAKLSAERAEAEAAAARSSLEQVQKDAAAAARRRSTISAELSTAEESLAAAQARLNTEKEKQRVALEELRADEERARKSASEVSLRLARQEEEARKAGSRVQTLRDEERTLEGSLRTQRSALQKIDDEVRRRELERTETEKGVLETLFRELNGPMWRRRTNWLYGDPCRNSWFGVYCTGNRVTKIWLWSNGIRGTFPSGKLFGVFTKLEELNLSDNEIEGELPAVIGELSAMKELYFAWNKFHGTIPSSYGNLKKLEWFSVRGNQITGPFPPELGSLGTLSGLDLADNPTLIAEVPQEYGGMHRLHSVDLHNTGVYGRMPETPSTWRRFYPIVEGFRYTPGVDEIQIVGGNAHVINTLRPGEPGPPRDGQYWRYFVVQRDTAGMFEGSHADAPLSVEICGRFIWGDVLVQANRPPSELSYAVRHTKPFPGLSLLTGSDNCLRFFLSAMRSSDVDKYYIGLETMFIPPRAHFTVRVTPISGATTSSSGDALPLLLEPVRGRQYASSDASAPLVETIQGLQFQVFRVNTSWLPFTTVSVHAQADSSSSRSETTQQLGLYARKGCYGQFVSCDINHVLDIQRSGSVLSFAPHSNFRTSITNDGNGRSRVSLELSPLTAEAGCYCVAVGYDLVRGDIVVPPEAQGSKSKGVSVSLSSSKSMSIRMLILLAVAMVILVDGFRLLTGFTPFLSCCPLLRTVRVVGFAIVYIPVALLIGRTTFGLIALPDEGTPSRPVDACGMTIAIVAALFANFLRLIRS